VTRLVDRLLADAGLDLVDAARSAGKLEHIPNAQSLLRAADILALGALADRIRAREVGDGVRLFVDGAPDPVAIACRNAVGVELLREVAIARITGPQGASVRLDWDEVGLEIAIVALGFGADELVGRLRPVTAKKQLPLADARRLRREEIARLVSCAQRRPIFMGGAEVRHELA
jgi:hypothetical protein